MFRKVLIANRGEIAVRIMATCREMGIRSIAVYSEVDRTARHVREADEVYFIGPAPATQSYLNIKTILAAARQSGAEAIHPGYGFLSENADFAEACSQAGIAFIGPSAAAMRLMGSKIAAKQVAQSVGAPIVPGYNGESQDETILLHEAERIGFPLLIKASAGGGGKGMRVVSTASDFLVQLAAARREAQAAFGDDTVFLERLLQHPRHIEIQILADQYNNIVHLGERECSIQRRHQKILEESPSVALTPALRAEIGAAAVRIAQAAGYVNAGTLEFMLDETQHFYFLEMNTRLQVEHPVTELVTGLDLVRHQLSIAAGERLGITQKQVFQRGHAIEVRIYAEDPAQNFLPSTGKIQLFKIAEGPGIRVDSGIEKGDEISQFYDPMLAKLIVYGEDRPCAIARLQQMLTRSTISGVTTNISLLQTISNHQAFQAGQTYTSFLEEHGFLQTTHQEEVSSSLPSEVLMIAAWNELQQEGRGRSSNDNNSNSDTYNPWQILGPWRMIGETYVFTYHFQNKDYKVSIKPGGTQGQNMWLMQIEDKPEEQVTFLRGNDAFVLIQFGTRQERAYVQWQKDETQVRWHGRSYLLQRRQAPTVENTGRRAKSAFSTQRLLKAPMAGTIIKVQVHEGDTVQAHQVLVILSAMKMEHTITAPYEGRIAHVYYQEGAVIPGGATLVEME